MHTPSDPPQPEHQPPMAEQLFTAVRGLGVNRIIRSDRPFFGGVCRGLAARFNLERRWVVLGAVLVMMFMGPLPYALAWLLLPDQDDRILAQEALNNRMSKQTVVAGVLALIGLGSIFSAPVHWNASDKGGPPVGMITMVAIGCVAYLWWRRSQQETSQQRPPAVQDQPGPFSTSVPNAVPDPVNSSAPSGQPGPASTTTAPTYPAPTYSPPTYSAAASPVVSTPAHSSPASAHSSPASTQFGSAPAFGPSSTTGAVSGTGTGQVTASPVFRPRPGWRVTLRTLTMMAVVGGLTSLGVLASDGTSREAFSMGAAAAALIAAGAMVFLGLRGRQSSLIGVLGVGLVTASLVNPQLHAPNWNVAAVDNQTVTISTATQDSLRLGLGDATLQVQPNTTGTVKEITVNRFAGDLELQLPKDVSTVLTITPGLGDVDVPADVCTANGAEYLCGTSTGDPQYRITITAGAGNVKVVNR